MRKKLLRKIRSYYLKFIEKFRNINFIKNKIPSPGTKQSYDDNDQPITQKSEDQLGHQGEAEILADYVSVFYDNSSRVISVEGPWGNGKTSLLNLMINELRIRSNKIEVIHFDPWFSSKSSAITEQLIDQLLKTNNIDSRDQLKKLLGLLKLANSINPDSVSQKILNKFIYAIESNKTIHLQKENIKKELKKSENRILVIIDDIDRLQSNQILEIFRAIKSVLDLPYVNYCIAYDKDSLRTSIESNSLNLDLYLEKIVQDSLHLLVPDKDIIMQFFESKLYYKFSQEINIDRSLNNRWIDIFMTLRELIKTPRRAKKLAFNVNDGYKRILNDVNLVDFICIEAIRLEDENLFRLIYRYKKTLTDNDMFLKENISKFKDEISKSKNVNVYSKILTHKIFPILGEFKNE